ncbi:MAG: transglycosylase domain-containing protein [Chloroflexota bacterium]|nr:transglycosylase domain-containing protein [Chloroflexota bacterium]
MFARPLRPRHLIFLLLLATLVLLGLYESLFADLPTPDTLITRASTGTTKITDRHGRLLYEILDPHTGSRTRVPLADVPVYLQRATIATEDATFYTNPGVSPRAIVRALYLNTREGEIVSGGSTITQQVARLVLMTPQERARRTMTRKLREAILAVRLSRAYDKDTLLEMYLNEAYYGNLAYGVEAAAQVYFGVHARDLDLAQSALLAGLPQAPASHDPLVNYDAARARQQVVLGLMVRQGFITQEQADLAYAEPLHFTGPSDALHAPHFVTYVRNQLEAALGAETLLAGGWHVTTTLNLDLQQRAEAIVQRRLAGIEEHEATTGALVALDPATGQVLVMVGSADYGDVDIDGAVNGATALRQPGSAMKPILYAAAFDPSKGSEPWTPASVVHDVRTVFVTDEGETYVPANYDNVYHGPVTLREALANSYNLPAVILQKRVGTDVLLDTAHDLGLSTLRSAKRYGLSLTLGGGEVTLLDLTAAYAVFATGGTYRQPTTILSLTSTDNDSPFAHSPFAHSPVLSPQVAYLVTHILSDNDARAPAFGLNSPLRLSRPAAAKTGTTTNWRDNWTVGYTPDLVAGVWVGNANGAPMRHVSGVSGAGPIWHEFMEVALHATPVHDPSTGSGHRFAVPDGLVWRDVCPLSGHLVGPDCPYSHREVFIAGTEPQAECDQHVTVQVDRHTGEPATDDTPIENMVEKIYWLPPPELREWARANDIPQLASQRVGESAGQRVSESAGQRVGESASQRISKLVVLTSPDPLTTLTLTPFIPREHQRIVVQAEVYTEEWPQRVILYADGQILAHLDQPPYRALWTLEAGEHVFRAVAMAQDGSLLESEPLTVVVEKQ